MIADSTGLDADVENLLRVRDLCYEEVYVETSQTD